MRPSGAVVTGVVEEDVDVSAVGVLVVALVCEDEAASAPELPKRRGIAKRASATPMMTTAATAMMT